MILLLMACGKSEEERRHLAVQKAVQTYYDSLLAGNYDFYMAGILDCDSMNDSYRAEVKDMITQFAQKHGKSKGGLQSVSVVGDSLQTIAEAMAFVELHYGSGATERIVVPVVLRNKTWRLRF